jgi:hypothetical protein
MITRMSKTEFFEKNGHRLVKVWEDDVETGDFMLMAPEEDDMAKDYESKGYEVFTIYEPSSEGEDDIVENEFNLGNNPFKIGYLILEKE